MNKIKKLLFDMWMQENHPYFNTIYGLILFTLMLSSIVSVVLTFFDVEWWWKLMLLNVVIFLVSRDIFKSILLTYVDEFNNR